MRQGWEARRANGQLIRHIRLDEASDTGAYPFTLPVVASLAARDGLDLDSSVTFLVGENGTGKSTLIEAIGTAAGFNPEGGSQSFRFATRATESSLGDHLILRWNRKPRTGFFLRAESYYNVASEIERLDEDPYSPSLLPAYGGVSPHERSHGESFLDLATHRFGPRGLYVLDEPEAALSVRGCMALLARLTELARQGSQIIIATHSPVLLALPGARIFEIDEDGTINATDYDRAMPVRFTRDFLNSPDKYLRHLLDEQ